MPFPGRPYRRDMPDVGELAAAFHSRSAADRRGCPWLAHFLGGGGVLRGEGPLQDFQAEVAAAFDPLVVKLGEDRSDQAGGRLSNAPGAPPATPLRARSRVQKVFSLSQA